MIGTAIIFALTGAAVIGLGLYGFVTHSAVLRRFVAFNVIGSGVFLIIGATGNRRPELGADPVPQALIITGIVVALAATTLALALALAHARASGLSTLPEDSGR